MVAEWEMPVLKTLMKDKLLVEAQRNFCPSHLCLTPLSAPHCCGAQHGCKATRAAVWSAGQVTELHTWQMQRLRGINGPACVCMQATPFPCVLNLSSENHLREPPHMKACALGLKSGLCPPTLAHLRTSSRVLSNIFPAPLQMTCRHRSLALGSAAFLV